MSTQPSITAFFGSRKRRASDYYATLVKARKLDDGIKPSDVTTSSPNPEFNKVVHVKQVVTTHVKHTPEITPKKKSCDIRSYLKAQSPYRPECPKIVTPVKFLQIDGKPIKESTPVKTPGRSNLKKDDRPSVKKSIRFEDEVFQDSKVETPAVSDDLDTDGLIKAANDLVERLKTKSKTLSFKEEKEEIPRPVSRAQLQKKIAKSSKLTELKASLSRLGKQANELIQLEKNKQADVPKLTKFVPFEVDVPKSPHKGALSSPVKSPAKPAYERFAHLTQPARTKSELPLPSGFQRLLELFISTDMVCSMMMNRGELITFKKLKPAVQELSRRNFLERHLGQFSAVLPSAFGFRQDKVRNFGSTSKADKYDLVVSPLLDDFSDRGDNVTNGENKSVRSLDLKKMTPNNMLKRKEAFRAALLSRVIDKHEEFLSELDPPIKLSRDQLSRWHPNFPLDTLPDVPPAGLPEPPNVSKPTSGREALQRAMEYFTKNDRMLNVLNTVSNAVPTDSSLITEVPAQPIIDNETKDIIDKRVAVHDPLKGISKSLLEKIRAKQAAKALETMSMSRMTPSDEKEFLTLSQLPDIALIVRTMFIDGKKNVFPLESVVEKVLFSRKRSTGKDEVISLLRRLVEYVPEWLSIFLIKKVEYLKANRFTTVTPLIERLERMVADKKRHIS